MQDIPYHIYSLGDSAVVIDFGNKIDISLNKRIIHLLDAIEQTKIAGIRDIVPAYSSLTIHYDVAEVVKKHRDETAFAIMCKNIECLLIKEKKIQDKLTDTFKIPVCYSPKYALDMADVSSLSNLAFNDVVNIHTSGTYRVYMIGFLPGFAYMGEVDERISLPRKDNPRLKIEVGSVGIAGRQTGIYPLASPGGWQIIGRTPVQLFNKGKESPSLLQAGDEVRFYSISEDEFENY